MRQLVFIEGSDRDPSIVHLTSEEIDLFTWIFDRALRPNYSEATEYEKLRITELLNLRRELNI